MRNTTGFNAYIFYIMVKTFYRSKTYNILNRKINKNHFANKWNKVRAKKDGHFFQKVENFLPRDRMKFIRFFSYYYLKDFNMYIKDMVDDEFKLYEFNEYRSRHVKEGVKNDFRCVLNFVNKNKLSLKNMFKGKNLPPVFKLYDLDRISAYGLIVFNDIFDLMKDVNTDNLDILDRERYNHYQNMIFDKFRFVVNDELFKKEFDWVEILKGI